MTNGNNIGILRLCLRRAQREEKGEEDMEKWYKKIDELTKLVRKLIGLALEIGTLVSIIMMILHSIK